MKFGKVLKQRQEEAVKTKEITDLRREFLKEALWALHEGFGFNKVRLTRFLYYWTEANEEVMKDKDNLYVLDDVLKDWLSKEITDVIGKTDM